MADTTISKHLKTYTEITFRRSKSLKDKLVHGHYELKAGTQNKSKGTIPCNKCNFYRYIFKAAEMTLPNGLLFRPQFLATYQSIVVEWCTLCYAVAVHTT